MLTRIIHKLKIRALNLFSNLLFQINVVLEVNLKNTEPILLFWASLKVHNTSLFHNKAYFQYIFYGII